VAYKSLGLNAWPDVGHANTAATADWLENAETIGDYLEAGIPTDGLLPDADLDMLTHGFENVDHVELVAQTGSVPADTYALYAYNLELYWRDGSGNLVKLTNGGTLAITAVHGIEGDYGTGSEEVSYSASDNEYTFTDDATNKAYLDAKELRHEEHTVVIHPAAGIHASAGGEANWDYIGATGGYLGEDGAGADDYIIPINFLKVGDRIKDVTVRAGATASKGNLYLYKSWDASGTLLGSSLLFGTAVGTYTTEDISPASAETVVADMTYHVRVNISAGDAIRVIGVTVVFDRVG
jgi:hypothetical protein